ncbi:MAG: penicillin-binding protein activator [Rickettsiales bacterium]|jgi:branched-chain amino acid transport system substrate-binding protein|nr:penicillin-binding protein activator [Rickettsiales bacterium]
MMTRSFLIAALASLLVASACSTAPLKRPSAPSAPTGAQPPLIGEAPSVPSRGVIPADVPVVKVALLVPLSGKSMAVGSAMLDAATMALHNAYGNTPSDAIKSRVVLLPKDSGNTPADSARVAKQAIEQGASFIVGPLFSQSVSVIAPMTKEAGITMLTFSNNQAIAADGIYTFGFLPEQQVERMAEYMFLQNIQRIAVLAPNDAYGQKVLDVLREEMGRRGVQVTPSELYAPSPVNIDAAVSRLAASYGNVADDRKFQAIFIADGGSQLKNILTSLKKTSIDLSKIKLIGTGQWDDPELLSIPEMHGALFPSAPPATYQNFERQFNTVYGYKPIRLASLAYDAMSLVAGIAITSPNGHIDRAALTDPRGYVGTANSLYRLMPNGTSERPLSILEITPTGFKVIDPAKKSFER